MCYCDKAKPKASRKRCVESPMGSAIDEESMVRLDELLDDVSDGLERKEIATPDRPPKRMKIEKVYTVKSSK